jgi:predicted RNA binding protein YcfA (HicA-like mRNA interferase family)
VTSREVIRRIRECGGKPVKLHQVGSHAKFEVGGCRTIVPLHARDIPTGTLRAIERDLESCLGRRWLLR